MSDERPAAEGDIVSASWANRVMAWLRSLRVISDGTILVDRTPAGQLCRVNPRTVLAGVALNALTGAGGIPAMSGMTPGKADVTVVAWSGDDLAVTDRTVSAYNLAGEAVHADKVVILLLVGGHYEVVFEPC